MAPRNLLGGTARLTIDHSSRRLKSQKPQRDGKEDHMVRLSAKKIIWSHRKSFCKAPKNKGIKRAWPRTEARRTQNLMRKERM